ncbi:carboxylesterase family protein [Streptomycetaceae bacterium NBC_01309]
MGPTVTTANGTVEGTTERGMQVFRGIPYAAPPEGELRFAAPAPREPWSGVRPAYVFGAAPPQTAMVPGEPTPWEPEDGLDCLTANVWTPDLGAADMPVMVWIYGGAWRFGRSATPMYDGTKLARAGVVVVTFNYRVGFEGLGHVPGMPENRALLDQIAALEWVRDNIAAFGGDPDQVTVFGESAGATSVASLLATPRTEGLFRRAIAQSVAGRALPLGDAHRVTGLIADAAGVPATLEGLRSLPPERITALHDVPLAAMAADPEGWSMLDNVTCFAPVLDGELVTDTPWSVLRTGARRDVDLMAGYTTDEYNLFAIQREVPADLGAVAKRMGLDEGALAAYRAADPGLDDRGLYTLLFSDLVFRMPSVWVAEAHATAGGRAFLYEFAWRTPAFGGALGAPHAVDVPFTFGVTEGPFAEMVLGSPPPEEVEELSAQVRAAWTGFAANGDPGWPAFTPVGGKTRMWDLPPRVESDPQRISREIWRPLSGI